MSGPAPARAPRGAAGSSADSARRLVLGLGLHRGLLVGGGWRGLGGRRLGGAGVVDRGLLRCSRRCRWGRCRTSGLSPPRALPGADPGGLAAAQERGVWRGRVAALVGEAARPARSLWRPRVRRAAAGGDRCGAGCGTPGSRVARRRRSPGPLGQTGACSPWQRVRAARSGPSGSATVPLSSSRPCAARTARGGNGGRRSATAARAANTSSGRTAGVTCRTTMCSIAQPASSTADALVTAARASMSRSPFFVRLATVTTSAREERSPRPAPGRRAHAGQLDPPGGGVDAVGQRAAALGGLDALQDVESGGSAASRAARDRLGVPPLGQADLQVLGLAGRARGRRAEVADLRVRREAGRERHRHLRPAQRALQRPREVAVRGEAEPAALGVADPQPLDGRRRRRAVGLPRHQTGAIRRR